MISNFGETCERCGAFGDVRDGPCLCSEWICAQCGDEIDETREGCATCGECAGISRAPLGWEIED